MNQVMSATDGPRNYLVLTLGEATGQFLVGLRKLGLANLKGLAKVPVYEVIDGAMWRDLSLPGVERGRLLVSLDREFAEAQRSISPTG